MSIKHTSKRINVDFLIKKIKLTRQNEDMNDNVYEIKVPSGTVVVTHLFVKKIVIKKT